MLTGYSLPLLRKVGVHAMQAERKRSKALGRRLDRRPAVQNACSDPGRMRRLAMDLSSGLRTRAVEFGAVFRDATDIEVAMRQVGFVHEFGRPLGEPLPPLDEAISLIRARLAANPHRPDGRRRKIAEFVRRHYLDIEPVAVRRARLVTAAAGRVSVNRCRGCAAACARSGPRTVLASGR